MILNVFFYSEYYDDLQDRPVLDLDMFMHGRFVLDAFLRCEMTFLPAHPRPCFSFHGFHA